MAAAASAWTVRSVRTRRRRRMLRKEPVKIFAPLTPPPRADLPKIETIERHGQILRPSPLAELVEADVESLNLTSGCIHQCGFCFARAYPSYGQGKNIAFFANTAEMLRTELAHRARLPKAVYLSPSTDPFPPFREVQEEACRVAEVLAEFRIEAWFMTRGMLRPFALDRLAAIKEFIRFTLPISTLDNHLRRFLEPLTAPPKLRLKLLKMLRKAGIRTQVAVDPLIPGLTDTKENLAPLVDALSESGVYHLTTGYLFLRRGIRENLLRELGPSGLAEPILEPFAQGNVLPMENVAPAKHLPRAYRQRGYALLMALAANRGMTVNILRLTNPDFAPDKGHIAPPRLRQSLLPYSSSDL